MGNTQNFVTWDKPVSSSIDSFRIYRGGIHIASVDYPDPAVYTDNAVTPKTTKYDYKIAVLDTCGIESPLSAVSSTMLLAAPVFNLPGNFDLSWTDYAGFTFTTYTVQATINNGTNWTTASTVAYAASTHSVSLSGQNKSSRYRIKIAAPAACASGFKYSYSNVTNDYTGINEISLNSLLNVYPNPNHGTFTLEMTGLGYEVTSIKVFNLLGETIYQSLDKKKVSEISIPGITPGMYQLEVITDKGTANKKITVK